VHSSIYGSDHRLLLDTLENMDPSLRARYRATSIIDDGVSDRELARLETEAMDARRGLWSDPRAIPPWEWRKAPAGPAGPPGSVVGNRNSHMFHNPKCSAVRKMAERNRVEFRTADEAIKAGYRKAGDCLSPARRLPQ